MNIVHVLHEVPFPPNSGVRCDMWRRQQAFAALGHRVFSISWASVAAGEMPTQTDLEIMTGVATEVVIVPIKSDAKTLARRVLNLRRYPSYVASRIPEASVVNEIWARLDGFHPDLVWLEGVHAQVLARQVSERYNTPLFYRSHNIEHLYVAEQAALAGSARQKLALWAGTLGLRRVEEDIYRAANHVFDISSDDVEFWRRVGFSNNSWLPPLANTTYPNTTKSENATIDLLYVGGLNSPNNIAGLQWYFEAVHPRVIAALPDLRVTIAGRQPGDAVRQMVEESRASLIANPSDVEALYRAALVMMNPIFHGSGVNIKTIDMLTTGCELVMTAKGVRGLPSEVLKQVNVADDPHGFAEAVIHAVRRARTASEPRDRTAMVEKLFGRVALEEALKLKSSVQSA